VSLPRVLRHDRVYRLYVIPGSHACRSGILMLEHKGVPYRCVNFVTLTHPVMARLHGFDAGGQTRTAGGRRTFGLRFGDRLGTVPALAANGDRISTNHGIARYLEERHPDPPLFPSDPGRRAAVEEAESWANETLQMAARRIVGVAAVRDPAKFARATANGRMGYLLYKSELARRLVVPNILGRVFRTHPGVEDELSAELKSMLDRVDALIADGVIGRDEPNVADLMIAPSLALILYREDVLPIFEGRPALELVDRFLPPP
jgi:glutathione S-transferase